MQFSAKQLGWLAMAAAIVGAVVAGIGRSGGSVAAISTGLAVAVFGLAVGVLALRSAVRTDAGVPHSLFGMAFGFAAVVLAVFLLGAQRGGVYSG